MTREDDSAVSLRDRARLAVDNNCDVFISVHHNATADATVNFPIVYFHGNASENQASVLLGRLVVQRLTEALHEDQTKKSLVSDLTIFPGSGTAVLRHSYGIPAVIGEASFFTNPREEVKLKQATYNKTEAEAYFRALNDFFAQSLPPIETKFSRTNLPPFPVLQEAERMDPLALLWQKDFQRGRQLSRHMDSDSLQQAIFYLERSIRSFPDSWLAGKAHDLSADIFDKLNRPEEAKTARQRVTEHYVELRTTP
jgi:hypothetical protein